MAHRDNTVGFSWWSGATGFVEVINLLSFHGGVVASWPTSRVTVKTVVDALVEHWRALGLPTYVRGRPRI